MPKVKGATFREQRFVEKVVESLMDPKMRRSMSAIYQEVYGCARSTAVKSSAEKLKKERIKSIFETALEMYKNTKLEWANSVSQIGDGTLKMQVKKVIKSDCVVIINKYPDFHARIKAVETANKMDGTYTKVKVAGEVAKEEFHAIRQQMLKDLRKPSKKS